MISDNNDFYKIIKSLKPHMESSIRENQKRLLPVFNTGKMFVTDKYRFNDTWYPYVISAEDSNKDFSILYIENAPFKNLDNHHSNQSFISRLDAMVYNNEIEPILLFINNRFVKWTDIDVVRNYKDTYFKIYDHKYNFFNIKKIDMLIFPFNLDFLSIENDYQFDNNLKMISEYINKNSFINKFDKLSLYIPKIKDSYKNHNIGKWYYNQLRLYNLGLLSDDRINKLRFIDVNKYIYDSNGIPIKSYVTRLNLLDKDSYEQGDYDSITGTSNRVLFKFNDNGELDNNGTNIIYMNNDSMIVFKDIFFDEKIDKLEDIDAQLFPENFIIFKNNMICNTNAGYSIDIELFNNMRLYNFENICGYNIDGSTYEPSTNHISCFIFYDTTVENPYNIINNFTNKPYVEQRVTEYFKNGNGLEYIKSLYNNFDFIMDNKKLYNDNINNAYNKIMQYNPLIFEPLQERYVYSRCITGNDANISLNINAFNDNRRGLKIPRMSYNDHETYIILFLNGVIIDNYCEIENHANYFFLPIINDFDNDDTIEILFFIDCNNNEVPFKFNKNNIHNPFNGIFEEDEIKLFSNEKIDSILTYPMISYNMNNVSFPVYDNNNHLKTINDNELHNHELIMVSSKKFIYQRIYVKSKSYKLKLNNNFRYCNNLNQYLLFINGRRIHNMHYFVTAYKTTRPFNDLYLYTARFVNPTDRIEVFYVPMEFRDINERITPYTTLEMPLGSMDFYIDKDAYLICNVKDKLSVPYTSDNYLFFMNGKKIPKCDLLNISSTMLRIIKDTKCMNDLIVTCVVNNPIQEISDYLKSNNKSLWDSVIDGILNNKSLSKNELDILYNQYIKLSKIEDNYMGMNTGEIAVLNEIVRDFWVTSGYDYQAHPFVYDYITDEFKTYDEDGKLILPSMDADPNINISKYDLHYLFFQYSNDMKDYYEIGSSIYKPTFIWEYNENYEGESSLIEYQKFNGIPLDILDREYTVNEFISTDTKFTLEASDGYSVCIVDKWIRFCNGIYYARIDEDLMDGKASDIYSDDPSAMLNNDMVNILYQPNPQLSLYDFEIGNNMYMVFAMPKRLAFDNDGNPLISFYGPEITNEQFLESLDDGKTTPILTNGKVDNQNNPIKLQDYKFELFEGNFGGEFEYTNRSGYTETYVIFKSNGYFTRIFGTYKFNFFIK